jgi:hypothetical protein
MGRSPYDRPSRERPYAFTRFDLQAGASPPAPLRFTYTSSLQTCDRSSTGTRSSSSFTSSRSMKPGLPCAPLSRPGVPRVTSPAAGEPGRHLGSYRPPGTRRAHQHQRCEEQVPIQGDGRQLRVRRVPLVFMRKNVPRRRTGTSLPPSRCSTISCRTSASSPTARQGGRRRCSSPHRVGGGSLGYSAKHHLDEEPSLCHIGCTCAYFGHSLAGLASDP